MTTTLTFAVLASLSFAQASEDLELPATVDLPATPPSDGVSVRMPIEYFTNFTRPTRRVVMVGEERPKDLLPMSGEPCSCDHPNLVCSITSHGARLGWRGTSIDWPLSPGEYGSCHTKGVTFPISIAFTPSKSGSWWRGDETLVVVSTPGKPTARKVKVWQNVPHRPHVEGSEESVSCTFDPETREVTATIAANTMSGKYACLTWEDGSVDVHLVPPQR